MKRAVNALFMAWGMFCSVPCPYKKWEDGARALMLLFFPAVGLLTGALWYLAAVVLRALDAPRAIAAAVMALMPYLLTGMIHLDGYMDSCDAILSRRDLEERRRILKDPHTGSFAVVCLAALFLMSYSAFSAWDFRGASALIWMSAAVRAAAGIAVNVLKPMGHSQYAGSYAEQSRPSHIVVQCVSLTAAAAMGFLTAGIYGFAVLAAVGGYAAACLYGYVQLRGMSGDISGFALTVGEFCGVLLLALL